MAQEYWLNDIEVHISDDGRCLIENFGTTEVSVKAELKRRGPQEEVSSSLLGEKNLPVKGPPLEFPLPTNRG